MNSFLILDLGPDGRRNLTEGERIAYSVWALNRIDMKSLTPEERTIHICTRERITIALDALPSAQELWKWAKMFGPKVETAERPLPGPGYYWRDRAAVQHMAEECQLKISYCAWCCSIMGMTPSDFGFITDSICPDCKAKIC